MSDRSPILVWFRRDLRLSDHAALSAAAESGRPVIPVCLRDGLVDGLGAAPKWRWGLGVGHLAGRLEGMGSRLVLRSGEAVEVLTALAQETGAGAVHWMRAYDPDSVARDTDVKAALKEAGIEARSFAGHVMFEPWTVETGQGGYYKVYTPYWKSVRGRDVATPLAAPSRLPAPDTWPKSEALDDWHLGRAMQRGAAVVRPWVRLGEEAAQDRLGHFLEDIVARYDETRDLPWTDGTSCLSENLAVGEISPAQCWHAGRRALEDGKQGAETFLKELVWREFAYHLMWHTPRILDANWREEWEAFPWNTDERLKEVRDWKRGRTGMSFVDAGLREMYVTGRMHNRARMITASYLTKHLLCHWKIGQKWFEDCLIDWDPASNAMGWQWSAGSGPDATPYFRVFNPVSQREKFDPKRRYVDRWIAEGHRAPSDEALSYFEAIPKSWGMSPKDPYPEPVVGADTGRKRALEAYRNRGF
ncbi:cryptochrome/photolyase family protein [Maliponia aquimaris]|uniref:Deoxyribodipyrimidine photo-lyase n=1 Tax=Maliponia aquimaris TaxID=1673631 RepID=A0A238L090_9RHOB|nr:deoxyribodipyrimidine photo-lyase [Maliponia aquimaris]SMX48504.1 Deoxyribodipyrimidine photo-lyase [Maliponia aquimaris]